MNSPPPPNPPKPEKKDTTPQTPKNQSPPTYQNLLQDYQRLRILLQHYDQHLEEVRSHAKQKRSERNWLWLLVAIIILLISALLNFYTLQMIRLYHIF